MRGLNKNTREGELLGVLHVHMVECIILCSVVQFDRYDQVEGKIAELDFARFILSYSSMNDQRRKKFFKRVRRKYGNSLTSAEAQQVKGGLVYRITWGVWER